MRIRYDRKETRQKEAAARNNAYEKLTPAQKLARLNATLGKDVGAEKQRSKLQHTIEAKPAKQEKSAEKKSRKGKKTQKNS